MGTNTKQRVTLGIKGENLLGIPPLLMNYVNSARAESEAPRRVPSLPTERQ